MNKLANLFAKIQTPKRAPASLTFARPDFPRRATMFFCIGAQKAGTTWLYDYLSEHPDCHFSPNKELHYFDVMSGQAEQAIALRQAVVKNLSNKLSAEIGTKNKQVLDKLSEAVDLLQMYTDEGTPEDPKRHQSYLSYLTGNYRKQRVICDITPAYAILNRKSFADMASIGNAKFAFIMRDPISRMWSQIRMAVAVEGSGELGFEEACLARALKLHESGRLKNIERANYKRTINALEASVKKDRIMYLFYEDLFEQSTADHICKFLKISKRTASTDKTINKGRRAEIPEQVVEIFAEAFAPQYQFVRTKFKDTVPAKWHSGTV